MVALLAVFDGVGSSEETGPGRRGERMTGK